MAAKEIKLLCICAPVTPPGLVVGKVYTQVARYSSCCTTKVEVAEVRAKKIKRSGFCISCGASANMHTPYKVWKASRFIQLNDPDSVKELEKLVELTPDRGAIYHGEY